MNEEKSLMWGAGRMQSHRIHFWDKELFMLFRKTCKSSSKYLHLLFICECNLVLYIYIYEYLPLCLWDECLWVWCEGEAVSPCQTDGYQRGSWEWVLLYSGARRLSCNLHCLSHLSFSPSVAVPFIFSVCVYVCVLIYSLCTCTCEYRCVW